MESYLFRNQGRFMWDYEIIGILQKLVFLLEVVTQLSKDFMSRKVWINGVIWSGLLTNLEIRAHLFECKQFCIK